MCFSLDVPGADSYVFVSVLNNVCSRHVLLMKPSTNNATMSKLV